MSESILSPGVLRQDAFEVQVQHIDQTLLISNLSHQVEELRSELEIKQGALREMGIMVVRLEGARDALRGLLVEVFSGTR